jgi:AraC family transcriptional regulator of adaptative response/methylated-DNA-[protein]-cysteine methyltransferase
MRAFDLPSDDQMYAAVARRDRGFDGVFYTAVRTTGIFCRPSCPAKTPLRPNVEFHATARDALFAGYRPCLRCRPLERAGATPEWLRPLLRVVESSPERRMRDTDLHALGLDPTRVRRWFKRHHGMTFQAYQRGVRLGRALTHLREGEEVTRTAFDAGYESLSGFNDAVQRLVGRSPGASRDVSVVHIARILTPLGPMVAGATEDAVCLVEYADRRMLERQLERITRRFRCTLVPGANDLLRELERELEAYFEGRLREFTIPLEPVGTDFQQSVWRALQTIPYGETRSYAQQAVLVGQPTAVRAVARANGDNRIAIVIPCHRVVGADGKLTGYGGGLWRKRWLLDLEQGQASLAGDITRSA